MFKMKQLSKICCILLVISSLTTIQAQNIEQIPGKGFVIATENAVMQDSAAVITSIVNTVFQNWNQIAEIYEQIGTLQQRITQLQTRVNGAATNNLKLDSLLTSFAGKSYEQMTDTVFNSIFTGGYSMLVETPNGGIVDSISYTFKLASNLEGKVDNTNKQIEFIPLTPKVVKVKSGLYSDLLFLLVNNELVAKTEKEFITIRKTE